MCWQDRLWADIQQKRQKKTLTSSLLDRNLVTLHCRQCKARLCSAADLRMRYSSYICIDDSILERIEAKPFPKRKEFRHDFQNGQLFLLLYAGIDKLYFVSVWQNSMLEMLCDFSQSTAASLDVSCS